MPPWLLTTTGQPHASNSGRKSTATDSHSKWTTSGFASMTTSWLRRGRIVLAHASAPSSHRAQQPEKRTGAPQAEAQAVASQSQQDDSGGLVRAREAHASDASKVRVELAVARRDSDLDPACRESLELASQVVLRRPLQADLDQERCAVVRRHR